MFLAIVFIVILARLLAAAFRKIKQPPVIGEILAGLLLGTSLLGQFHYDGNKPLTQALFPTAVVPILKVLANLGLVIYMFIVGLELDTKLIRGNEKRAGAISLSSVAAARSSAASCSASGSTTGPQAGRARRRADGGRAAVRPVHRRLDVRDRVPGARPHPHRPRHAAHPARRHRPGLRRDRRRHRLVACWPPCRRSPALSGDPLWEVFAFSVLYIVVMFTVVRRRCGYVVGMYQRAGRLTPDVLSIMLVGLILSAWVTDRIGIHFIFGAFVFGVVVPREGTAPLFHEILERLEQVSVLLLLPDLLHRHRPDGRRDEVPGPHASSSCWPSSRSRSPASSSAPAWPPGPSASRRGGRRRWPC